jgi:hypothetical protein
MTESIGALAFPPLYHTETGKKSACFETCSPADFSNALEFAAFVFSLLSVAHPRMMMDINALRIGILKWFELISEI